MRPVRWALLVSTVAAGVAIAASAAADVVFPARLQLSEVTRGTYEVAFTLPILEGRTLRAQPLIPPICRDVTERQVDTTPTAVTTKWRVACEPPSLAGEAILIEGLLGTQTELMVEVKTLDGRVHAAVLKPSRPGLIVPPPPSLMTLTGESVLGGVRRMVRYTPLWLLVLVATCLGASRRSAVIGILGFAAGHAVGQWVAANNGLLMYSHLPPTFVLLTALVPALDLARGETKLRGWVQPFWLAALLLGVLAGGAQPETVPTAGLSSAEQVAASIFFAGGVGLGLVLMAVTMLELRRVLRLKIPLEKTDRIIGYFVGIVAIGLLVHRAAGLAWTGMPREPLELALLAVVLGAALPAMGVRRPSLILLSFSSLLTAGLALGLAGITLPFGTLVGYGSLFLFGLLLLLRKPVEPRLVLPLAALGVLGHSWGTGQVMVENVSLPAATAAGAGVAALSVFYASLRLARLPRPGGAGAVRLLGAVVAVLAVWWRVGDYVHWVDGQVSTEAVLGLIRVPLLALLLLLAAAALWPRRRRVLSELGIERRTSVTHWVLVGLAFFLLPVGTFAARNPFFEPRAPRGEDARRVVSQVLWNTYHAFNLTDEDELYERLSESVTGDLVTDLYLDSRRRLTAGTRQGAEVTVRDVSVVEVDDEARGTDAETGFVYTCRWIVTARVRHLQHVHHRQNIYTGNLTIKVDGERWKIARVELTSEDRVVLPWTPT